jgi:hypothetical protein
MKHALVEFEGSKEIRTYYDLNHGADVLILIAEEFKKGSTYTIMSSILLRAFTFEAYLNHLGTKTFKFWDEIDSIRVMDKYKLFCKHMNLSPDYSKRPYQTLKDLFKFRNELAHWRSYLIKITKEFSKVVDPFDYIPKAKWREYCTIINAKKAKKDIQLIIKELHCSAGLGNYPFMDAVGTGGIKLKNTPQG